MINIDASDLIINPDVGTGDIVKFMVVGKDPKWADDKINWNLVRAR